MALKLAKFPPFPPREQWDFSACPKDDRFTCLLYECYRIAQNKDPSFTNRLPLDWKSKYPQWPDTPYLQIPEKIRRQAQPELDTAKLKQIMADEVIPSSIPEEAFETWQLCCAIGEPPNYEKDGKAYVVLEIRRGMAPQHLLECGAAYIRTYHVPKALTVRLEGGASYARQLLADLNAVAAYILLETLTPAEATAVTRELPAPAGKKKKIKRLAKHGLYSTVQKWQAAQERGEFLIKKTLEGKLTATLFSERLASLFRDLTCTKNE
jgi:hypothetical protein